MAVRLLESPAMSLPPNHSDSTQAGQDAPPPEGGSGQDANNAPGTTPAATIRPFRREDQAACLKLYTEGLFAEKLAANDTGFDVDDIQNAYLNTPGCGFWVAQASNGEVVGMVGVQHYEPDVGEIRRLRVRPDHRRRGIGTALVETALKFCQEQGYLKIALDTFMERQPAVTLFAKFRFRHVNTRQVGDRELLYFFLDLYTRPERAPET